MAFRESVARKGLDSPWEHLIRHYTGNDLELYLLTKAVISAESEWNPDALNPRDPSAGLMQVMPHANRGAGPPGVSLQDLLDPETNIAAGVSFLRAQMLRYPGQMGDAVSAYNGGSSLRRPEGGFRNQAYVDAVLTYFQWYVNHLPTDLAPGGIPEPEGPPPESWPGEPGGARGGPLGGGEGLGVGLLLLGLLGAILALSVRR